MDYDRLRELQQKFEENPRRYFAPLANEYRKGGQPKRAIEICRTHLAQMPGHMSGQIVFAQSLFEAGEYPEAREVFQRALVLDPENLIALRSLGDMSLQEGNTDEARSWYTRLLDADPKDTTVIALVQEIDAAEEATPVTPQPAIPGVDADVGDQQIPWIEPPTVDPGAQAEADARKAESPVNAPAGEESAPASEAKVSAPEARAPEAKASTPETKAPEATASAPEPRSREAPPPMPSEEATAYMESKHGSASDIAAPLGLERHYPTPTPSETPTASSETRTETPTETPAPAASASATQPPSADEIETLGVTGETPPLVSQRKDVGNALDWTPTETPAPAEEAAPAEASAPAAATSGPEEKTFTGASAEPFVNETMAQLYLKQGYRQLALQVYYRLSEARPNDLALKDRIREIEAAEAATGGRVEARQEQPSIERPAPAPTPVRSPSIESPTPADRPGSEEAPSFDRSSIDSPPTSSPGEADSIEAPAREEPTAQPEAVAADREPAPEPERSLERQPSIKEFFATLGRRRPSRNNVASNQQPPQPDDVPPMAATGPAPTLDNVFAGAEVSPADSRAASRLAGAFSGAARPTTTPRTPAVPTPRINPRLQTQESEEDVAKFRAWLDGLTGE